MKKNKKEYKSEITKCYDELKDFQRLTVDYVYDKFYKQRRNKFLVADEVGLGKTIVAKGLIAKAFEKFKPTKHNPTFNVIYICSNQALAKENLKKLNFTKDKVAVEDPLNRLIYLALKKKENNGQLRFDSLTPATSLNISNKSGSQKERAIIFGLLTHYSTFKNRKNGLKLLLKGGVSLENWNIKSKEYHRNRGFYLKSEVFKKFRSILLKTNVCNENFPKLHNHLNPKKEISVWDALKIVCKNIKHSNYKDLNFKNELIVQLRHLLTKVCLEYLHADLIILDEFQRYSEILNPANEGKNSPAVDLAQTVFELKNTKILMLSATPFKPYTTLEENGNEENHSKEFQRVLKFLMKKQSEEFWKDIEKDRRELFSKIYNPEKTILDLKSSMKLKNRIENNFKDCILRTERNKVSDDQNVLIKSEFEKPLPVTINDVNDFIVFDKLNQSLRQKFKKKSISPVEYCKSCPFPLSFLDGYQVKKNLQELKNEKDVKKLLKKFKTAWISLDEINNYTPLGKGKDKSNVPNAKMQWLIDQLNENDSWKWLWVPPTINYYPPQRIFPNQTDFSKTLIFSSWKMVPRAVSTILSYEAERKSMTLYNKLTKNKDKEHYFATKENKKRKPSPILAFKRKSGTNENASMSLFILVYPCKFLADLYDPQENIIENYSWEKLLQRIEKLIEDKFKELNLKKYSNEKGESERWYWALPLLFDKYTVRDEENFENLFYNLIDNDNSINKSFYKRGEHLTGSIKNSHVLDLFEAFLFPEKIGLGSIPRDLFKVLALMCLSSPSICFLRSILKSVEDIDFYEAFNKSYSYGISKIHFFNKPESISIVKSTLNNSSDAYWLSVLKYCLEGNLQSSLDEYIHLLTGSGYNLEDISDHFGDVLSLTTSRIKVDDLSSFIRGRNKNMRIHYAVDFGSQDMETDSGADRTVNVRQAFNSPYRPFILTSTSIGQEGLDFHYYCGKVMHWNLPHNAIDIEQREGRVNRYKGLTIRKNVARKYLREIKSGKNSKSIWKNLFDIALRIEGKLKSKCELVPYWHIEPVDNIKINRVIPIYPFSRDIQKYRSLIDTLTYYRLTFGQPRQEELVEVLQNAGLKVEEIELLRKNLMIDLSP